MTFALWALAIGLSMAVWFKQGPEQFTNAFKQGARQLIELLPRILAIVVLAGFIVSLLPAGFIAETMGRESGLQGIAYAIGLGILIPGGASIAFSVVIILFEAGIGPVQLITFLTSWSVFALHRIFMFELPLLGPRFTLTRLIVSLPLPLIAAGISWVLFSLLGY